MIRECLACGRAFQAKSNGRPARYCSDACKAKAYRGRQVVGALAVVEQPDKIVTRKYPPKVRRIVGVMCAVEKPDRSWSWTEELILQTLMRRDAKIWAFRMARSEGALGPADPTDAHSRMEAQKDAADHRRSARNIAAKIAAGLPVRLRRHLKVLRTGGQNERTSGLLKG